MGKPLTDNTMIFAEDGPDACFQRYLAQGEFRIQCCDNCQQYVFYPRLCCPHCGSAQLRWTTPSGKATVYSTSVPRTNTGAYNIALVELAEGPRMMSRVVDIAPEAVTIGMPVVAFVGHIENDLSKPLVLFRPQRQSTSEKTP